MNGIHEVTGSIRSGHHPSLTRARAERALRADMAHGQGTCICCRGALTVWIAERDSPRDQGALARCGSKITLRVATVSSSTFGRRARTVTSGWRRCAR